MFQLHWVWPHSRRVCFPSVHCSDSRLLSQELSDVGPGLHALPRSKLFTFRFSGTPQRYRRGWPGVLHLSQLQTAQVTRCLACVVVPSWRLWLIPSPVPAAWFSGCTTGTPSQVCRVSILGSWSLAATLPVDVNCPESQEVLVSREVCLQFGRMPLWGRNWPLPALAALTCLGMGRFAAG